MILRDECPVCGHAQTNRLLEVPYANSRLIGHVRTFHPQLPVDWLQSYHYTLLECGDCGTLYQRAVLDPKEAQHFYSRDAVDTCAARALRASAHLAQDVLLLRQFLSEDRPRVLDFGMGWGRWALMAQAFGCEVCGVEINPAARQYCGAHGIRVMEPEELPASAFDFIHVDQVLEHLADPRATLRLLAKNLGPRGIIFLGVPGRSELKAKLVRAAKTADPLAELSARDFDALAPLEHLNLFNNLSLKRIAADTGLNLFRPPVGKGLAAGTLWNSPPQWNRNLYKPFKDWSARGTHLWFQTREH